MTMQRPSSSVTMSRALARAALVASGALFLAQGGAKALDPAGYLAALDAFHVLAPARLGALSLGALGLAWTVLELLAGGAMLYGGLARAPRTKLPLAGIAIAIGLSFTYLALDVGALARHVPTAGSTSFGAYLAQPLTASVLAQDTLVIVLLAWLFTRVVTWWTPRYLRSNVTPFAVIDH
jgi:hypothetical protein